MWYCRTLLFIYAAFISPLLNYLYLWQLLFKKKVRAAQILLIFDGVFYFTVFKPWLRYLCNSLCVGAQEAVKLKLKLRQERTQIDAMITFVERFKIPVKTKVLNCLFNTIWSLCLYSQTVQIVEMSLKGCTLSKQFLALTLSMVWLFQSQMSWHIFEKFN